MIFNTNENNYEKQTKKLINYILFGSTLFIILYTILFNTVNITNLYKLPVIKDLNGINFIIGLISIPSCWLYYRMYKNNEFFILTLSYISIWIEYLFINYNLFTSVPRTSIDFPFFFRVILLTLAIFNNSKISTSILKRKRLAVCLSIIINILGTLIDINFIFYNKLFIYIDTLFNIFIIFYYFLLLGLLFKRGLLKKEFIYAIIASSISIFTFRRLYYFAIFNKPLSEIISYNLILSFIGYLILLVGLYVEIVRRIEESEKLNTYVEKTEQKYTAIKELEKIRTQFFANLSHEIKTPINIIYSCIQLLDVKKQNGYLSLAEAYNKYDNTIKQNCYRMLRLVNNIMDITKIDSGFMKLNFTNYEIVCLIEDITLSIIPYVESKQINVIFDTYVEELEIKCDPESIERVILNLLANAIKFTNIGGNIFVTIDYNDDWVTISIKDDGVGIPPELKDVIFERFVQGDKSLNRMKEGTGIGLAITKSLVELHNGIIYLNKEITTGSEFIIKLPNVKFERINNNDKKIDSTNKSIIDKIHIEFSDIYEIF